MTNSKLATTFAVALGLFGSLAASASAETLKIGLIAPLTGGGAPWGNAAASAARVAASEANATGGLDVGGKKYQVEVIAYDDQYKAAEGLAAYNRLVNQDGVKFLLSVVSAPTIAVAPSVENDKVILIAAAGVEKAVDPKSKYMFRMLSLLRDYVPSFVGWVKQNVGGNRVAIIDPNDESGWAATEFATTSYKKNGYEVVSSELFERSQKDFAPLITKINALKPDIIELASTPPATAGLIVRQARELGFKGTFTKDSGAATKDIIDTAGKEAAEGVVQLHYGDPKGDGYKRLAVQYQKEFGQQPDDLISVFYDGAKALLVAIQKAGDVQDTAKVSEAMFTKVFPMTSIQGHELVLGGGGKPGDPNQMMTTNYISVIKNGEAVMVGKVR